MAAGLGCPVGTVYWRLHQARKRLRSALTTADAREQRAKPAAAPADNPQPVRSLVMIGPFGFASTEASRLLKLAREEAATASAPAQWLAEHLVLVEAGTQAPPWASTLPPQGAGWPGVIGVGPVATAAAVAGAVATAILFGAHAPQPAAHARSQSGIASATALAPAEPGASTATPAPAPVERGAGPTISPPGEHDASAAASHRAQGNATGAVDGQPLDAQHTLAATPTTVRAVEPRAPGPSGDQPDAASTGDGATPGAAESTPVASARAARTPTTPERSVDARVADAPHAAKRAPTPPSDERALAEMRSVARAERLLDDEPARALALARSTGARYPGGYFREERAYVEVIALRELGRSDEMRAKAAAFLRAYPSGLYSERVRRALNGPAR